MLRSEANSNEQIGKMICKYLSTNKEFRNLFYIDPVRACAQWSIKIDNNEYVENLSAKLRDSVMSYFVPNYKSNPVTASPTAGASIKVAKSTEMTGAICGTMISLNTSCYPGCFVCNNEAATKMPLEEAFSYVDLYHEAIRKNHLENRSTLLIGQTEPFIQFEELVDLVRYASKRQHVSIVTTGYWASDLDQASNNMKRIIQAGMNEIYLLTDSVHIKNIGIQTITKYLQVLRRHKLAISLLLRINEKTNEGTNALQTLMSIEEMNDGTSSIYILGGQRGSKVFINGPVISIGVDGKMYTCDKFLSPNSLVGNIKYVKGKDLFAEIMTSSLSNGVNTWNCCSTH